MTHWRKGMKLVCVSVPKFLSWRCRSSHPLVKGHVYTLRGVFLENDRVCIRVEEITCSKHVYFGREFGFKAHRFRPVVNGDPDISVFTGLLDKINQREEINA